MQWFGFVFLYLIDEFFLYRNEDPWEHNVKNQKGISSKDLKWNQARGENEGSKQFPVLHVST